MKATVKWDQIVESVCRATAHLDVHSEDVHAPSYKDGFCGIDVPSQSGSTFHRMELLIPNEELAQMIHGDNWDGDCSDGAFSWGGGGYDPTTFTCGVLK